jgi:hypothetical protein
MMKIRGTILILSGLLGLCPVKGQDTIEIMQHLADEFVQEYDRVPRPKFGDADIYGELLGMSSYRNLADAMPAQWQVVLDNYSVIAPTRLSRIGVLHALENLQPQDYLKAINQLLIIYGRDKNLPEDEFIHIIIMSPTRQEWFLSYNYQEPEVMDFLKRLPQVFPSTRRKSHVEFILSGRKKVRDEILRKENAFYASQPIPYLSASSMAVKKDGALNQTSDLKLDKSRTQREDNQERPGISTTLLWLIILALAVGGAWLYLRR